jgi:hypothetical protein
MWPFRQKVQPAPQQRSNPVRIAVLEHDLLGIAPQPGTMAAMVIALRQVGTCLQHLPIETTALGDPRPVGLCQRCGNRMVQDEQGQWGIA